MPQIEAALDGLLDKLNEREPFHAAPAPEPAVVSAALASALRGMKGGDPGRRRKK